MKCEYCKGEKHVESGMFNSDEDSPEVEFWYCPTCQHTYMDDDQEKALEEKLKKIRG